MIHHRSPISGVATSPDGRFVATAGYDNQVILWDALSRTPLARGVHDHLANQAAFGPDGTLLATASSDHTARIWSVPSMKLRAVMHQHDDDVEMVAFCPTSPRVATASRDARVRVFGLDGSLVMTLVGHEADVISIAWSPDGIWLTSSSDDGTVRRWNTANPEAAPEIIDLGGIETDTIVLTRSGRAYAGNDEGNVIIIQDGKTTTETPAHASGIKRLVLGPDESMMASLSYDRTIKLWRLDRDGGITPVAESEFPNEIWARSAAFLSDTRMVFGTFGDSYAEYDSTTNSWTTAHVGPTPGINAVAEIAGDRFTVGDAGHIVRNGRIVHELGSLANFITPVGPTAVCGGQTGQVFDLLTGQVYHQHRSPLNCGTAFEKDGAPHVIIGAYTGEGLVFRLADGGLRLVEVVRLHDNAVKGLASDGETIFSVCATAAAAWHRIADFAHLATDPAAHGKIANGCAVVGADRFASVSRDRKLRIWQGRTSEVVDTPHTHSIKCVVTSPDGSLIATGSYNGRICIYRPAGRSWTSSRPTTAGISSLTWSSTMSCFLASSYDGNVYPANADPSA